MNTEVEKWNWQQLKDFCNGLDEEQLKKPIIMWRESEAISDISAGLLEDDYYIHAEDDEGCYPLADATHPVEELKKVYDIGTPILFENF